ncbi:MAG TPA: ABC transporter permease subunit [Myxococcales bacterium]|jgi:Cu-processing system permease protein|nr:ABC transporter permease subunit [Myxococcales bacterium]
MEFLRTLAVIAGNTVRELIRNKLLYNILIFAVLLIASSMFVAQLTIGQWDRIILDMGLAAMELSGVLVAVLIGVSVVAGEIDRRTIFATLAKPLRRSGFLLGRYAGLLTTLAIMVAIMFAVLALVLWLAGYTMSATAAAAGLLIFVELAIIAASAMLFSSFTTPVLASAFSLCLFLIGHLLSDLQQFRQRSNSGLARLALDVVYRVLPDLELFNLKSSAANALPLPPGILAATLYGCAYTVAVLFLAVAVFGRRDLK